MSKRNKSLIITTIIFLVIATIVMLVGGYLSGWDMIAWVQSPEAMTLYCLIGAFVIIVLIILGKERIKRL